MTEQLFSDSSLDRERVAAAAAAAPVVEQVQLFGRVQRIKLLRAFIEQQGCDSTSMARAITIRWCWPPDCWCVWELIEAVSCIAAERIVKHVHVVQINKERRSMLFVENA